MFEQGLNSNGEDLRDFFVAKSVNYATAVGDDGMTRQEFRDECDINVLMATYERNGVMSHLATGTPQYIDVSDVPDLPRALELMADAERAFMSLPAAVRREFDNNAVQFVQFAADPANIDKMRTWGLAPMPPPAATPPADAIKPESGSQSPPTGK